MASTRLRKLLHLLAAPIVLIATACSSDISPSAPPAAPVPERSTILIHEAQPGLLGDVVQTVGRLVACEPQPYAAVTRVVGPEGATLRFGKHTLVIPAGALRSRVTITAEAPSSIFVQAKFQPHGLVFSSSYPAQLTMDYGHCRGLTSILLPKKILYVDDLLRILERPFSRDNARDDEVTATIKHFSSYLVAF
jgi:hypothetical protein